LARGEKSGIEPPKVRGDLVKVVQSIIEPPSRQERQKIETVSRFYGEEKEVRRTLKYALHYILSKSQIQNWICLAPFLDTIHHVPTPQNGSFVGARCILPNITNAKL
jgi:hypothetical protein